MPAKGVILTPPSLRAMASFGTLMVSELKAIKNEDREFQKRLIDTVERHASRVEEQISGLRLELQRSREELEGERQRALQSERKLDERLDNQAMLTTAHSRKVEFLENEVRRLEGLLLAALGQRELQQDGRKDTSCSKEVQPTTTSTTTSTTTTSTTGSSSSIPTAQQGRQTRGSTMNANSNLFPITKVLIKTSSQIFALQLYSSIFHCKSYAHTTSGACRGKALYSRPSHLNRQILVENCLIPWADERYTYDKFLGNCRKLVA